MVTPTQWSIVGMLVLVCMGVYWWVFFRNPSSAPTVIVSGYYPSIPQREVRELPVLDGVVRWEHEDEDEQDMDIALDGGLTVLDHGTGQRVAYVDVERGIQYLPNLPPEGVTYEQPVQNGHVETRRIDGRILAAKRDDISVSRWRQTRSDWREEIMRYLPWILGLMAVTLLGILYWLIKFAPVSEPPNPPTGGGGGVQNAVLLLWMTRPWTVA